VKIVNKRPRNLLNKTQNVFINGKQVKTDKNNANNSVISTILRHNNYRQLTASLQLTCVNSDLCTVTTLTTPTEVSGCGQLAGGLKVGRGYKCVSKQSEVYYTRYARIIHFRLC